MDKVLELQEQRTALLNNADFVIKQADKQKRPTTEEEQRTIKDLLEQAENASGELEKMKHDDGLRQKVKDGLQSLSVPQRRKAQGFIDEGDREQATYGRRSMPRSFHKVSKLRNFPETRQGYEDAYTSGMFGLAVIYQNPTAMRWCTENGIEYRAHSEGVNTAGGALVPDEMSSRIIDLRDSYGIYRANTFVAPMGSDHVKIPRKTSPLTMTFAAEGGTGTESQTGWNQVSLTAQKGKVFTRFSEELDQDAVINIGDMLVQQIGEAFALGEDTFGFTGNGTAAHGSINGILPLIEAQTGFLSYVNAVSGTDTLAGIASVDLATLMSRVPGYAKGGAKWYCSSTAFDLVFGSIASAAGGNTIDTLAGAVRRSYLGFPIELSEVFTSSTGTINNTHMLAFGNLALASTMGERRGITISRSNEVYWETDEIGIKGIERIDIKNHELGSASVKGPFAVLIGNT